MRKRTGLLLSPEAPNAQLVRRCCCRTHRGLPHDPNDVFGTAQLARYPPDLAAEFGRSFEQHLRGLSLPSPPPIELSDFKFLPAIFARPLLEALGRARNHDSGPQM